MATETGVLILKADSRQIKKATKDLKDVERQSRKTEKQVDGLGKSFVRLGKFAGIAAVAVAGVFARSVIRNTVDQEKAVALLNNSLRATGRFTPEATKSIQDYASALQELTGVGDEAIINAQAQLATFNAIGGDAFPRATEAALDLSRTFNQGLKESVIQVGKALQDPVAGLAALRRIGVTFSETQKDQIKNFVELGDLAKAQGVILKGLEAKVGGAARAYGETLGGSVDKLKTAFGDLLEGSGGSISGAQTAISELTELLRDPDVKEGFSILTQGAIDFVKALVGLPVAVSDAVLSIRELFGIEVERNIRQQKDLINKLEDQVQSFYDTLELNPKLFEDKPTQKALTELQKRLSAAREELRLLQEQQGPADPTKEPASRVSAQLPRIQQEINTKKEEAIALTEKEIELVSVLGERREYEVSIGEEMIDNLKFETQLMGLSNEEREKAIALRYANAEAASWEGQNILELIDNLQQERERVQDLDNLRSASTDFFQSVIDGSKSAKEAIGDFFDNMRRLVQQKLIEKLVDQLFGAPGTTQTGSIGSIFANFLGGGRAVGGPLMPGKMHPVTETGPEMLTVGNRNYLISPPQGGTVKPITQTTNSAITNVFNLPPSVPRETVEQLSERIELQQKRARTRNK